MACLGTECVFVFWGEEGVRLCAGRTECAWTLGGVGARKQYACTQCICVRGYSMLALAFGAFSVVPGLTLSVGHD